MSPWLKNYFQSDELPPSDILKGSLRAAHRVIENPADFPKADFETLYRLIDELNADQDAVWAITTPENYSYANR